MACLGISSFIDQHSDWMRQIVVVDRKSGNRVRICIDLKHLSTTL